MELVGNFLEQCYIKVKSKLKSGKGIASISILGMLLITLPMLVAGAYSHPAADDYTFCAGAYYAANNSTGFLRTFLVFKAVFATVKEAYFSWSGYYTASFFAALRPNFYNENLAFLNSLILIGGFMGGIFYALNKIIHKLWGLPRYAGCVISTIVVTVAIQLVPSASETFYWYTAGITYTLLFAGSMVLFANFLVGVYRREMSRKAFIGNIILAVLLGGGILPVNIPLLGLLTAILADVFFNKGMQVDKKLKIRATLIYVVFLTGMLVGSLAPSTFWRLGQLGEKENAVPLLHAIIYSVYASSQTIIGFITPLVIMSMGLIALVAIMCLKKTSFEFKRPAFMTFIAWCVMFSSYFPIYYGTGFKLQYSDSRYNSIVFFQFIIWLGLLTVYWTGFLYRRIQKESKTLLVVVLVILFALVLSPEEERREPWSLNVIKDFANGTIQQYDRELDERYANFLDEEKTEVIVSYPSVIPYCIFQAEPVADTWSEYALENYYDKEVIIKEK